MDRRQTGTNVQEIDQVAITSGLAVTRPRRKVGSGILAARTDGQSSPFVFDFSGFDLELSPG